MLYICATPIGNLEDITIRTLNILNAVDYIVCEDTRRTLKLMNHYKIKKRLVSVNEHSEFHKKNRIIEDLKEGKEIALVSDAGMPGIQDPGILIIQEAIKNNLKYTVLPGASALITAIVASGINQDEFLFLGFLPRKHSERTKLLEKYAHIFCEAVLYEAPHRFLKLAEDIYSVWGDREIVIIREISKAFEEYLHTTIREVLDTRMEIKGEIVLIVKRKKEEQSSYSDEDLLALAKKFQKEGLHSKEISKKISELTGISKKRAYDLTLQINKIF